MNVIARQHPAQDVDLVLAADLTADVAHPEAQRPGQDLVTILGRSDDVIAVIENAMLAGVILHNLTFRKMSLRPGCGSFSGRYDHNTILSR